MTDETKDVNNVIPLFPDALEPVVDEGGVLMEEWTFTNDHKNPMIRQLFRMFYDSVFKNKIGLMHAKVKGTNQVQTIIVGVEDTPEGTITWPIAKVLTEAEHDLYLAPDGHGGYLNDEEYSDGQEIIGEETTTDEPT